MIVLEYILLVGVIVCAIAAPLCKRLLASVIVYMALSLMMAVLWSLLQSPDLAITEAAVGAGVTSILFFLTLIPLFQTNNKHTVRRSLSTDHSVTRHFRKHSYLRNITNTSIHFIHNNFCLFQSISR